MQTTIKQYLEWQEVRTPISTKRPPEPGNFNQKLTEEKKIKDGLLIPQCKANSPDREGINK